MKSSLVPHSKGVSLGGGAFFSLAVRWQMPSVLPLMGFSEGSFYHAWLLCYFASLPFSCWWHSGIVWLINLVKSFSRQSAMISDGFLCKFWFIGAAVLEVLSTLCVWLAGGVTQVAMLSCLGNILITFLFTRPICLLSSATWRWEWHVGTLSLKISVTFQRNSLSSCVVAIFIVQCAILCSKLRRIPLSRHPPVPRRSDKGSLSVYAMVALDICYPTMYQSKDNANPCSQDILLCRIFLPRLLSLCVHSVWAHVLVWFSTVSERAIFWSSGSDWSC